MKKFIIFALLILNYLISIIGTFFVYFNYYNRNFFEQSILFCIFAGILGSTIYMTRGFYQSIAEKVNENKIFDFNRWIWWYLVRPILGAVAGAISFLIIYLALDLEISMKNQISFYLLSFLCGYNFHEFVENKLSKKIDL